MSELLDAALAYAEAGYAVFPIEPGRKAPPLIKGGVLSASKDTSLVKRWWTQWPRANIGIAMGEVSGIFGIDIDYKDGCDPKFLERIPPTVTTISPSGGHHAFYKNPEAGIKNGLKLEKGATVRSDGYYFVAFPSLFGGSEYRFKNGSLYDHPVEECPEWILELNKKAREEKKAYVLPEQIPHGEQHIELFKFASSLRAKGMGQVEIETALIVANARLEKPAPEENLIKLAKDVCSRYDKGPSEKNTENLRVPEKKDGGGMSRDNVVAKNGMGGIGEAKEKEKKSDEKEGLFKDVWEREPIKFLGFIDGKHHYISKYSKKVVSLNPSQHTELNLLELMPLRYWATKYCDLKTDPKTGALVKSKLKWNWAADDLIQLSLKHGYFDSSRIRGSGVFRDQKRVVINCGNKILVNGLEVDASDFKSEYIYIPGPKIELGTKWPEDCFQLIDICQKLLWQKESDSKLFLGWLVCAILSGALEWRPHLYITGVPGVGKSWILENIVYPIIRQFSEYFLSNSSEAGIRQSIKSNALAVIWDEPEVNNESDNRNVQKVLALTRQASFESAGRVSKGTASGSAMEFSIKSCFLLGSIKDAVQEGADLTRFTILTLNKKENPIEAATHFKELQKMVYQLTDSDFPKQFSKMVCDKIEIFESNIKTFKKIISAKFNSRVAQQYASLLAGYCVVEFKDAVSEIDAEVISGIISQEENVSHDSHDDLNEVYHYLTSKMIVVDAADGNSGTIRMSVGEIVEKNELVDRLKDYGMRVIERDGQKFLFISYKNPQLKDIFKDSKWVSGWGRSFAKMKDAKRAACRLAGVVRKGIEIPILRE